MNPDVPFKVKNKLFCLLFIEIQYYRFSLLLKKYFKINVSFKANCKCYSLCVQPFHITLQQRKLELLPSSSFHVFILQSHIHVNESASFHDIPASHLPGFIHILKSFRSSLFAQGAIKWFYFRRNYSS